MPVSADQLEFRLLLESSVDAVMIHDPETYDVIWANRVAADIYGCSPDELTKMTYKDLAPRDPTYSLEGSRIELQRSMEGKDRPPILLSPASSSKPAGAPAH